MGLKNQGFDITVPRLNEPKGIPYWSPTLKAKQVCSIYPSLIYKILISKLNANKKSFWVNSLKIIMFLKCLLKMISPDTW